VEGGEKVLEGSGGSAGGFGPECRYSFSKGGKGASLEGRVVFAQRKIG